MLARTSFFASLVILVLAATGCGGDKSSSGSGAPAATTAAAATPAPAGTGKPTAAECEAIPKHFLEVTLAEDEDFKKASELEREIIRKSMRSEMAKDPDIKAMAAECAKDMSRKEYNCIMAAKSTKALDKCTE